MGFDPIARGEAVENAAAALQHQPMPRLLDRNVNEIREVNRGNRNLACDHYDAVFMDWRVIRRPAGGGVGERDGRLSGCWETE
jgi:hypothetical protein